MRLLATTQQLLAGKRGFIIRYQIRYYSLPYETAEMIKSQLDYRDAQLVTPKDANPSSVYKGLVILAAGPIAKYPALKKFSTPYLEFGLPVITMGNSKTSWGFSTIAQHKMARVFNVVSANLTESCPVVMKLYCSGFTTYLPAAVKEFSKPGCKLQLAGAIIDSGPPTMTLEDMMNLSKFLTLQNRYPTWFHKMRELAILFLFIFLNGQRRRAALDRVIMDSPFLHHTPQLYMYSTTDYILKVDYLNKLIRSQQQHNADVTRHIFKDTLHMLHRLKYPKEYDNLVCNFLRKKCDLPI